MSDVNSSTDNDLTYATNIGLIVLALSQHEIANYGDCSINDPILNIIDEGRPAGVLVTALGSMDAKTAAGIVGQLKKVTWPAEAAS